VGIERSLTDFPPMPLLQQQWAHRIPNPLLQAEQYHVDEIATLVDEQRTIFNPDQAAAFDAILESVTNNQCHDLAKWLSHYLYFFSFSFFWTYWSLVPKSRF